MDYNAAADLIERNLAAGRGEKIAFIDDHGRYSYRGPRRASGPVRQRDARPRHRSRAAHPSVSS